MTLSGNLDFAYGNVSGTQAGVKGSTISTSSGLVSSTSVINIVAVEDLGGGMKATAKYGIDPRSFANDSLGVTNNGAANEDMDYARSLSNSATGLARDEAFVGIEGGFGNIRLGSPNSIGLRSHLDSSPLGTGIGAGYTGGGTSNLMTMSWSTIRYNRSISYDSPNFNGFTVSLLHAPGNDQAQVANTATGLPTGDYAALNIPNNRKVTEVGLSYANGPLKVSYVNISQAKQTNPTGWYAAGTGNLVKTSVNAINANYKVGSTTLYAGWNDGDAMTSTTTVTATEGYRLAVKQNLGAIDLIAQYTEQKATASTGVATKSKVTGLRADYSLSKTNAVYFGYEDYDNGATSKNTRKVASVGIRKSF